MTDAFNITMHKDAQAAADALGVNLLFQCAPKFDPERQVSVLDADSFHQVERMVAKIGACWAMIAERPKQQPITPSSNLWPRDYS